MNHRVAPLLPIAAGLCLATEVRYYDDALPTTMNPMFARTSVDFRTADLVFDRLVYRNEITQELQSDVLAMDESGAFRAEYPSDVTVQLYVRDGITWHDGVPFDADDVCFTLNAMLDEQTPSPVAQPFRLAIDHCATAPDHKSFGVTFRRVFAEPLAQLQFHVLPKHAFNPDWGPVSPDLDFSSRPIGTGPMSASRGRKSVAFTAYPNGHHHAQIASLSMSEGTDPFLAVRRLINGDVHGLVNLPRALQTDVIESKVATVKSTGSEGFLYIAVNTNKGPLADRRVRQALNLTIDRTTLREVTVGSGPTNPEPELVSGPFTATSPYYNRQVPAIEHADPARAEALLVEAGAVRREGRWLWNDEVIAFKIGIHAPLDVEANDVLRQLQNELEQAGFSTEVYKISQDEWARKVVTGQMTDFDLFVGSWRVGRMSSVQSMFHSRTEDGLGALNIFNYKDADTDKLLDRFDAAKTDVEARDQYRVLHAHLAEDLPYLYLWSVDRRSAWRNEVQDVTIGSDRYFGTFDEWHVAAP